MRRKHVKSGSWIEKIPHCVVALTGKTDPPCREIRRTIVLKGVAAAALRVRIWSVPTTMGDLRPPTLSGLSSGPEYGTLSYLTFTTALSEMPAKKPVTSYDRMLPA